MKEAKENYHSSKKQNSARILQEISDQISFIVLTLNYIAQRTKTRVDQDTVAKGKNTGTCR